MTGDKIVALVAIAAMLVLVTPALARRRLPANRLIKLILVWAVIFVAATAIVMVFGRGI